jgi:hypothetical protein
MADTKIIFVAFAIEGERQRDFLKGPTLHPRAPFEFVDTSVKQPYDSNWKERVAPGSGSRAESSRWSAELADPQRSEWGDPVSGRRNENHCAGYGPMCTTGPVCRVCDLSVERPEHQHLHRLTVGTSHA